MKKTESYSNDTIRQLLKDLEEMQHYLLMVKAAALAFSGYFNECCPDNLSKSPFEKEETAYYFVLEFLRLDPDTKLEEAMDVICELRNQAGLKQAKTQSVQQQDQGSSKASIDISIRNLDIGKLS